MTPQQRIELYQRRDALLASLNYATDDEEADELKRQIEAYNRELADAEPNSPIATQLPNKGENHSRSLY